jgi:major inositol transporter-like SP family MFS transporter
MLIIGFSGVVASQALLAVVFLLPQSDAVSYTILAAMMLFVAFGQCFIGTCVWLLLSKIVPMAIRGFAMGIAVFGVDCERGNLLPVPDPGCLVGFDRNLRPVRAGQHRVPGLRCKVCAGDKGQSLEELEVHKYLKTSERDRIAPVPLLYGWDGLHNLLYV